MSHTATTSTLGKVDALRNAAAAHQGHLPFFHLFYKAFSSRLAIGMRSMAISARDYPTLSACTLIITIMVLIANLVVEMLYAVVDPRIKAAQQDS